MTRTELGKALGLSRQILHRHERDGRLTQEPGGGFDLDKARAQLAANVNHVRGGKRPPAKPASGVRKPLDRAEESSMPNLAKAQLAHEMARAKRAAIMVGQLEGTLIDARKAELAWSNHITAARNAILAIESEARSLFGDECADWLRTRIRRALTELSEYQAIAA